MALNSIRAPWSCVVQPVPPFYFIPTYVSLSLFFPPHPLSREEKIVNKDNFVT